MAGIYRTSPTLVSHTLQSKGVCAHKRGSVNTIGRRLPVNSLPRFLDGELVPRIPGTSLTAYTGGDSRQIFFSRSSGSHLKVEPRISHQPSSFLDSLHDYIHIKQASSE